MGQFSLQFLPENQVFTVKELNAAVRSALESEFQDIRVNGEISGCRVATSGHCYFNLKEQDSVVKCVCYRSAYRYLKVKPLDGIAVVVRGQLGVFEARGEYQIQVESLEPQGSGVLQLAFDELKRRLAAEGLFESTRKRQLPGFPKRVGIVTSPQGAVISDMLHVFERRFPGLQVRLFPALVQGEGAAPDICAGIEYFSQSGWADVVVLARGGGSVEDLWTFNTEAVARAIAKSAIPVISAIGHETDFTIADFVADFRAPTPTAAAEILCISHLDLLERIKGWENQMSRTIQFKLIASSQKLQKAGFDQVANALVRMVGRQLQRLDDFEYRMREQNRQLTDSASARLLELQERLHRCDQRPRIGRIRTSLELASSLLWQRHFRTMSKQRERLETAAAALRHLNPLGVLERGYAVVQAVDGRVLRNAKDARIGSGIKVRLAAGELGATVTSQSHSE